MKKAPSYISWGTFFVFAIAWYVFFGYAIGTLINGFILGILLYTSQKPGQQEKPKVKEETVFVEITKEQRETNIAESAKKREIEYANKKWQNLRDKTVGYGASNEILFADCEHPVREWYSLNPEFALDLLHADEKDLAAEGIDQSFVDNLIKENEKLKNDIYKTRWGKMITTDYLFSRMSSKEDEFLTVEGGE